MNLIKNCLLLGLAMVCLSTTLPNSKDSNKEEWPGYLILDNDQKIEGKIIPGSVTDNEVKVKFIEKGKKKTYKPKKIKAYGYQISAKNDVGKTVYEWIRYVRKEVKEPPKPFGSNTVFMKQEVGGSIELFSYYVEMRAKHYFITEKGGKIKEITERKFRRITLELFRSYKALHSRIGQKQFKYKDLIRMVRDYNYWIENGHDTEEYVVSPENYDLN